jgi:hypothetical protein
LRYAKPAIKQKKARQVVGKKRYTRDDLNKGIGTQMTDVTFVIGLDGNMSTLQADNQLPIRNGPIEDFLPHKVSRRHGRLKCAKTLQRSRPQKKIKFTTC